MVTQTRAAARRAALAQTPMLTVMAGPLPVKRRGRRKIAQSQPMKGGWVLPHGMGVSIDHGAAAGGDDISIHQEKTSVAERAAISVQDGHPVEKEETSVQTGHTLDKDDDVSAQKEKDSEKQIDSPVPKEDTSGNKTNTIVERKCANVEEGIYSEEEAALIEKEAPAVDRNDALEQIQEHVVVKEETLTVTRTKRPRANYAEPSKSAVEIAAEVQDPNYRMSLRKQVTKYALTPGYSPYPYRSVPTKEDCYEVYRILAEMHGECMPPTKMPAASLEVAGCGEVPCVLDALLRTLVSGNTTMERANQAIQSLVAYYGLRQRGTGKGSIDWEKVRISSEAELIKVIRTAGSAPKRSGFIKRILDAVYEENLVLAKEEAVLTGKPVDMSNLLSLDHMHEMTKDEAMAKFISYKGIGIKTAACVILFCLQKPCFAVDTHVHRFCGWLGWAPAGVDPDNCYRHTDFMVPDELKYGLHQLFIRHGQLCFKCRAITRPGTKDWNEAADCPLEHLLTRDKVMAASTKATKRKIEDIDDEKITGGGSEDEGSEYGEKAPRKSKKARKPRVKAKKDGVKEEEADVEPESESE